MNAREILNDLRAGTRPSAESLAWFARELGAGNIDDAQAGAFAMGVCRTPLDNAGRVALTLAMRDSGEVLSWKLPGPVVDKHSTGGIGDPISLILGPALAALGAYCPMISGRGLGHTGGTLDKIEAIPGVSAEVDEATFRDVVGATGWALVAANANIAPADRKLYAIRDVTSTVQSVDLITASILSKKLAGGVGPLILDVKVGSGAVMASKEEALDLAKALVSTANGAAGPAAALVTDMNQPCVPSIGNALEIAEVMRVLTDPSPEIPAFQLTLALGAELLRLAGMTTDLEVGKEQITAAITSGKAADCFGRNIAAVGGPPNFVDAWKSVLPNAAITSPVVAKESGYLSAIDGQKLGMASVILGGGRLRASDRIDPSVGISNVRRIGEWIEKGEPLAMVHGGVVDKVDFVVERMSGYFALSDADVPEPDLIKARVI